MICKKLNKSTSHRRSMFRSMVTDILLRKRITTTLSKAKTIRPIVEKYITIGKTDTLFSKRKAYSFITRKDVVKALFSEISPKYIDRPGGYTRIIKLDTRRGDNAQMAIIELI